MARILAVVDGFPSILYPSVELARRLAAGGHRVSFAAQPGARGLVEDHDLEYVPLRPSRYPRFLETDIVLGPVARLASVGQRRERAKESMAVGDFAQVVHDVAPDLVLIDGEMHEHIIAASAAKVPIVLLNSFASIWREPGLPPPHCLVRPGIGWRGSRAGISLLWLAARWRKRGKAAWHWIRRVGCDRVSILRQLACDAGFDLRRETDDSQWLIPFTYRRLPVLSLHAQEFEFPHRPPPRAHYVGPMLLESRTDRSMAEADRARLEAIFERSRRGDGGHTLIYAGFGSSATTDPGFLRRLAGIVAGRPGWELVISLSDRIASNELGPLPERVHAFTWVPQTEVLSHAKVVLTHGGIHTIDECVLSGVPLLIYCGFETDMAGNTARVVHHGIGIAGDRRDSTETMCAHIDRLLVEPGFKAELARLRACYLAYADQRVLERTVASLIGGRP